MIRMYLAVMFLLVSPKIPISDLFNRYVMSEIGYQNITKVFLIFSLLSANLQNTKYRENISWCYLGPETTMYIKISYKRKMSLYNYKPIHKYL